MTVSGQISCPPAGSYMAVSGQSPLSAVNDPILERLDEPPALAPKSSETPHDKVRRDIIAADGQWLVLNTRATLTEASARRLARSYQRAKPARLVDTATGRFQARPFVRENTWLVAVAYQPGSNPTRQNAAAQAGT